MAAGIVTGPVIPAHAQPADCAKVELITFRGSGESKADDASASNGFSGPTLQRIVSHARGLTGPGGFSLAGVPVFGVPYPAVAMDDYFSDEIDLFDSVEYGRLLGGGYISGRRKKCSSTRFLLVGYSQGVLAARRVAADLPKDWVAGVFGLGDPAQKGGAYGVVGPGSSGNGMYRKLIEEDGRASSDSFYDLRLPSYLFCHEEDPVCDFKHVPFDFTPHTNYGSTNGEREILARILVAMAAEAAGKPPTPPVDTAGPADLMFVIDTTGSMAPYLSAAVDSAARTADALHAVTAAARVGLVEYRDHGDSYVARTVVPLTDDFDAFDAGLRGLGADGGGDTPEAVYTGIVTALGADWSRSASRSLIVLGDAPAHDPEAVTGLTVAAVTDIAKGIAPIPELPPTVGGSDIAARGESEPSEPAGSSTTDETAAAPGQEQEPSEPAARAADAAPLVAAGETVPPVAVYALSANADLTAQLAPIATATGGLALPLESPDDVTDSIIDTVEDAATAPTARLSVADTVVAGNETVLSGLASTHTGDGTTFGFDFDGDGIVDETTDEPAATHTYRSAGPVDARLVVTDSRGRTSEATARIDVRAVDSLTNPQPTEPTTTPPATTTPAPTQPPTSDSNDEGLASTGTPGLAITVAVGLLLLMAGVGFLVVARRRRRDLSA